MTHNGGTGITCTLLGCTFVSSAYAAGGYWFFRSGNQTIRSQWSLQDNAQVAVCSAPSFRRGCKHNHNPFTVPKYFIIRPVLKDKDTNEKNPKFFNIFMSSFEYLFGRVFKQTQQDIFLKSQYKTLPDLQFDLDEIYWIQLCFLSFNFRLPV